MSFEDYNFDDDANGKKKSKNGTRKLIVGIVSLGVLAGGGLAMAPKKSTAPSRKPMEAIVQISAPPPPPPVVQPPPPPEPQEQEMVKQDEIVEETPEEEAPADDQPALSSAATGKDNFGMKASKGSFGQKKVVGGKKSGKFDRYALTLQNSIAEALRRHASTKSAKLGAVVMLWADASGKITKAKLSKSTGNAQLDEAISGSVLLGLQLPEPPPADMPMPINMQITANRPN